MRGFRRRRGLGRERRPSTAHSRVGLPGLEPGTCGLRVRTRLRLTAQGSRRGPVNERETTRNYGVARERKDTAHGPGRATPQVREASPATLPRWGSRVRIPSSAPKKAQAGPVQACPSTRPGSFGGRGVPSGVPSRPRRRHGRFMNPGGSAGRHGSRLGTPSATPCAHSMVVAIAAPADAANLGVWLPPAGAPTSHPGASFRSG